MPIALDRITRRKLVLGKQLYREAVVHAAGGHGLVRRVLAVVQLDLATETILGAAVEALAPGKTLAGNVPGLVQQAEKLMAEQRLGSLPDRRQILHVRSVRNDAQHKAKYPAGSVVDDCRTYTRDFLSTFIPQVWGISFDEIRLSGLVENEKVRIHLQDAETALEKGDYRNAADNAMVALRWALLRTRRATVGEEMTSIGGIDLSSALHLGGPGFDERLVVDTIRKLQDTVSRLALGIDELGYRRCWRVVGEVSFNLEGVPLFVRTGAQVNQEEGEFVVGFCTDSIVRIESLVGALEEPFKPVD